MILIDSAMHRVLDVMRNRGDGALAAYFEQYSVAARCGVQTITIDLFTPYRKMIKALFPNAKIIADRFHVVTQAYRALNQIRIQTMKKYGSDSREYRQLKRFWKLLMKKETGLDFTARKKRINFQYSYLTDQEQLLLDELQSKNRLTRKFSGVARLKYSIYTFISTI
ncbi:transposase [Weissella cibaria]|uniref:transposase n=1 Tax=Weissella cibaria TaxID=137591 RepID=UPI00142F7368|nr:transposase [Weissella cibaria]